MYEEFYGLRSRPFLTVPDPNFLYWSDAHSMAFTMLRYGLMTHAPITVITGEIGAGKTTLVRELLNEMPDDLVVGLVSNMQSRLNGERGELLQWVMMALDQEIGDDGYVALFRRFQEFVVESYAEGRRVLLIFDEAQNLSIESLEELRMLSNINADGNELLQLLLVGQPELRERLGDPRLEQFVQRISSDFHLGALTAEEADAYIQHRLAIAGASYRIFPERTCHLIHEATRGVPRLVNILADLCLVMGYSAESVTIEEHLLREFLSNAQERGLYRQFSPLSATPHLVRRVD